MIHFFGSPTQTIFAVESNSPLSDEIKEKLIWLFGDVAYLSLDKIDFPFIGPRAAMVTPWSTNAVEITQNMGIKGISRIEKYEALIDAEMTFDPMVSERFNALNQEIYTIQDTVQPIIEITDIEKYNDEQGLALSSEEIEYLKNLATYKKRALTDSEVFGFSQVNSEHCRHKIFNGTFIINGEEKEQSLFQLIKATSKAQDKNLVSAYKDNVAFIKGTKVNQFAPINAHQSDFYDKSSFEAIISLKAETHNFPTTVEPFSGAATGSGGEIRDRMAGGQGSIPLAGTAVYMTSYPRHEELRPWTNTYPARPWLYQRPIDILIKASNGASDFGNKFGQPLICGSLLTFEHQEGVKHLGFDKVIMLAGGIGYGVASQAQKQKPSTGDLIVIMGGDNYRIGMGGAAVSSKDTGDTGSSLELNAVQRSNPEMQKRVANVIRALVESTKNPIVSIHDHGAGGHLNCLSELVEETGGTIELDHLPVGDPTLSFKELVGNESQERMGLIIKPEDLELIKQLSERERAPFYVVGKVTDDMQFRFESSSKKEKPIDLHIEDLFGSSPKTILEDNRQNFQFKDIHFDQSKLESSIQQVLKLESVACKDWLTNKVDRCVGGLVAKQQCCGPLQLPLNNVAVMSLSFDGVNGIATAIGHAPVAALIDPKKGSKLAITKSITNILWAPIQDGLSNVSLSANWMWPAKNEGENARLYEAVEAVSKYAIELGMNVPTGKDSLSMKQKYKDKNVLAPGTVIITGAGHCSDITKVVEPVLQKEGGDIYYINISQDDFKLGGSAFAQSENKIGLDCPDIKSAAYVKTVFEKIQHLINEGHIEAGHDISSGGLITSLLEMCFADNNLGANLDLSNLGTTELYKILFAENPGIIIQTAKEDIVDYFSEADIACVHLGKVIGSSDLNIKFQETDLCLDVKSLRDHWYETSYLFDKIQSGEKQAKKRFNNYKSQPLRFRFPENFDGQLPSRDLQGERPKAAVIREKGSNSEREMAHAMYLAGFDVKDIHMTDLMSGRENLEDVQFIGAVGGFSNSDVLGSAKGWAGAFKYNENAKRSLENFFKRQDVLSVGICNGCQLFLELDLINPDHSQKSKMTFNDSHKHESAFTSVIIPKNNAVMLSSLEGCTLGIWISHGEGKFHLPNEESRYNIVAKYGYNNYPANPNGSDYNAAMIASHDGRHLATMPHLERSMFKWNWAHYPSDRDDTISPWIEAFVNARKWIVERNKD